MTNETEPLARLWLKWRKDALSFVRECVGVSELAEWQVTALKAISENDRVAIRSGHGVGKTMFDALVILWFGSTREDAKIPVTAPVSDQIDVNLFGELRKWHAHMRDHSAIGNWLAEQIEVKDGRVDWANGNMCVARTARRDNPEALAGFHATNLLFLIDEASGVAEIIFETALGALSTPGAKQLMTGNPTQPQGYFYNAFNKNRAHWFTLRVSSEDVPRARGHIDDVIRTYGRESNAYRVRVLGEFPVAAEEQVVPLDTVEAAIGRVVAPVPVLPLWGVDVGFRVDRSALSKRVGNVMPAPPKYWHNYDTMQLTGVIKQEYDRTDVDQRPSEILVDSIGIGAGVVHRLRELDLPARGVAVSEAATNPRYHRLRDEIWWKAREWFGGRDVTIPSYRDETMEQFIAEVTAPLLRPPQSSGKITIESKDETKKRLSLSPDLADSFVLTFAGWPVSREGAARRGVRQAIIEFDPMEV
ncbi:MAG: hypothetical protein AB7Q04_12975 [Steroidobacteraceae bacterium]